MSYDDLRLQEEGSTRSKCASCCFACGVCRILCYTLCCRGCSCCRHPPPPPKQDLTFLCLGLEGAGKSTLLSELAGESTDNIQPTVGFAIKVVVTERAVLNVKELGGAPAIREYWERYFSGHDGIIFVLDSSSSQEQLQESKDCLSRCLGSSALHGLPVLVVCSKQDLPGSRDTAQVKEAVEDVLKGWKWTIVGGGSGRVEEVKRELNEVVKTIIDNS